VTLRLVSHLASKPRSAPTAKWILHNRAIKVNRFDAPLSAGSLAWTLHMEVKRVTVDTEYEARITDLVCEAIRGKLVIKGEYQGLQRDLCPHVLVRGQVGRSGSDRRACGEAARTDQGGASCQRNRSSALDETATVPSPVTSARQTSLISGS
jgi:hypothetical protein